MTLNDTIRERALSYSPKAQFNTINNDHIKQRQGPIRSSYIDIGTHWHLLNWHPLTNHQYSAMTPLYAQFWYTCPR